MGYIVNAGLGQEPNRYYANSSDIPGRNLETGTPGEFVEAVPAEVPGLLGTATSSAEIDYRQHAVRAA